VGRSGAVEQCRPVVNNLEWTLKNLLSRPITTRFIGMELTKSGGCRVPAKWRPAESGVELTLVLWPKSKEGPCVRVLPPRQMAELMKDLEAMPNTDPNKVGVEAIHWKRIGSGGLDKVGRICLPDEDGESGGHQG